MKQILTIYVFILILVFGLISLPQASNAQNTSATEYELLAPLGIEGERTTYNEDGSGKIIRNIDNDSFGKFLNSILKLAIGLASAFAVLMIVVAGIKYMTQGSVTGKTNALADVWRALWGLAIALLSVLLLNTVNPNLVELKGIDKISVSTTGLGTTIIEDEETDLEREKKEIFNAIDDDEQRVRAKLSTNQIFVIKDPCTHWGDENCTSVGLLGDKAIDGLAVIQKEVGAEILITGGTETWLHSRNTNHKPGSPVVDLRTVSNNGAYIYTYLDLVIVNTSDRIEEYVGLVIGEPFRPKHNSVFNILIGSTSAKAVYERSPDHWHVIFN